ncbi:ras-related protein Rab-24 [Diachasma alloeum]|uniref:ras-related protein Rab-24 n=1 Tax=Diachasma alloeum TaxID=454923 RepID=UPI0007381040|nr:ras-related protein Rab-24 [Diachasma alloeum]
MHRVDMKIVLLGHGAVGKTSLMERFVNERFNESLSYQNTIGAAFASKQIEVDDQKLILGIWDTAGSERYDSMTKIYYRGARAAIVCYEISNQNTFNRAKHWVRELRSVEEKCKIYLCATKNDLVEMGHEPAPSLDTVEIYASGIQSKLYITSSKTGENIAEMFREIAQDFLSDPSNREELKQELISLSVNDKGSSCCAFLHRR